MRCGRSGSVTDRKPRSALRRISSRASSGSVRNVMPSGMIRSGYGEYHSSNSQSFQACVTASPSSGSEHCEKTRPQNPVIMRREVERRPHAVDVHVLDAGVDVAAARPHLVEAERLELHRLGPPAGDRVHADLGELLAVELPHLMALLRSRRCAAPGPRAPPAAGPRTCPAARPGGRRPR